MSLYEDWLKKAFSKEGRSIDQVWDEYLPKEQKIYEYILRDRVTNIEGTIQELGKRFDLSDMEAVAFVDGINGILPEPYEINDVKEDTFIKIDIEFEKLYKKMVEYKAEHLYTLPEWDAIFDDEKKKELIREQRRARTVVKEVKVGRNDPCPCGSGKKYKKCCGA